MLAQQHQKITTRGVRGMILARLDTGNASWVNDIAMRITSDQAIESYAWLGSAPQLREFVGVASRRNCPNCPSPSRSRTMKARSASQSKDMRRDKLGHDHDPREPTGRPCAGPSGEAPVGPDDRGGKPASAMTGSISSTPIIPKVRAASSRTRSARSRRPRPRATVDEFSRAVMLAIQQIMSVKDDKGTNRHNQSASEFQLQIPIACWASPLRL